MKKILFLIATLLFSSHLYAASLGDLRDDIRRCIRDNDSSNYRHSNATLNAYINDAQDEIQSTISSERIQKSTTIVLVPNTTFYTLPEDFLFSQRAEFYNASGQVYILTQRNDRELFDKEPSWQREGGNPTDYWVNYPSTTDHTQLKISFIPIMGRTSTGTVTVWYTNQCPALSGDSDVPFEGRLFLKPYHTSIVYFAVMRLMLLDGLYDEAKMYNDLFTASVKTLNSRTGEMPDYNPGAQGQSGR